MGGEPMFSRPADQLNRACGSPLARVALRNERIVQTGEEGENMLRRLWLAASIVAATALMVDPTITARAGVNHTHPNPPLAGIILNALD